MPTAGPSTKSVRRIGLAAAAGCALVGLGVVGLLVVRGRTTPGDGSLQTTGTGTGGAQTAPVAPPVDVTEIGLKNAGRARFQFVDRQDPTKIVGVLEWASLDPKGAGRSVVSEPRATIYLGAGRVAYVRAATGRIFTAPKSEQPESGTFEGGGAGGGVPIAIFEPAPDGTVNVERDRPAMLLVAPSLAFNLALGEVTLPGSFVLSSQTMDMAGSGLRLVVSQSPKRLELLEIEETKFVRMNMARRTGSRKAAAEIPADASPSATPMTGAASPEGTPSASEPLAATTATTPPAITSTRPAVRQGAQVDFYRMVVESAVRLALPGRGTLVSGDRLEMWATLIDNALPAGAFGTRAAANAPRARTTKPATRRDTSADEAFSLASVNTTSTLRAPPAENEEEATLTWQGPITVRPLEARPEELSRDDVALRLTADRSGAVLASDGEAGLRGQCAWLDYGFTTRTLALAGSGARGVTLESGTRGSGTGGANAASENTSARSLATNAGRLEASALSVNLATGTVHVRGAGEFRTGTSTVELSGGAPPGEAAAASHAEGTPERRIAWTREATLNFDAPGGSIGDQLNDATFMGDVTAGDPRGSIAAGQLRAFFADGVESPSSATTSPDQPRAAPTGTRLLRVAASDGVMARTTQGASLAALSMDVSFAQADHDSVRAGDPMSLAATGNVAANREGWTLNAGAMNASLGRNSRGEVGVMSLEAATDIALTGPRLEVHADRCIVGVEAQKAELWSATQATIERDGGTVSGSHVVIDGQQRDLRVLGPGTFTFIREATTGTGDVGAPSRPVRVTASWTGSLHADDDAGTLEAVGDATAVSSPTPSEVDTIRARRLTLAFTPANKAPEGASPAAPNATSPKRELLSATAEGGADPATEGTPDTKPATVDSRRYAQDPGPDGERALERIVYIDGPQLVSNEQTGIVEVPGAGHLLIDDRRAGAPRPTTREQRADAIAPLDLSGGRGTSVFSWGRSLALDRRSGALTMSDAVHLLHRSAPGEPVTTMDCDSLTAELRGTGALGVGAPGRTPAEGVAAGQQAELVSAVASGNVRVSSQERQLSADRLTYDALRQRAEAAALGDNRVTFFDPAKGQPVAAAKLVWDIARNSVRVVQPLPISAPGNTRPGKR